MFIVTPLWVEMLVPDEVWTAFCCSTKDQPRVRHWEEKRGTCTRVSFRYRWVFEKARSWDQTTCFFEPLPLMTSDSILSFLDALIVISTPPSTADRVSVDCANGSTLYEMISPVVGLGEDPVTTCRFAETTQLELTAWSGSAETTSTVTLWDFPSVSSGAKGVRST